MPNLDTGDTGFMLLCSSLVMLMTPGLAFFYGGLVGRKNVLAIMMQSFVSMGWTTVIWFAVGYSLCFSGDVGGVIGNLEMAFLQGVTLDTPSPNPGIPLLVHVAYQMMFAIITPALITGAFANRISFKAYMLFLTLWLFFVYFPFAHMLWGGGILQQWGGLDFAGGIVVHNTAGMAALASVLYVGRRRVMEGGAHSVPLVALGTGLLWFGWYGFNAGSEFRVDSVTAVAFLNTDVAASFAAITWMAVGWWQEKRPTLVGLLTGAVAGLATITPAAGYVSPITAVIIGITSGAICYFAVALKNRLRWDDARRLGRARRRRRARHPDARLVGLARLQPGGHRWAPARQSDLLRQAARRNCAFLDLGFRLHLRDAVAHRPRDAGQGRPCGGGERARRGAARRDCLYRDALSGALAEPNSRRQRLLAARAWRSATGSPRVFGSPPPAHCRAPPSGPDHPRTLRIFARI